MDVAKMFSNGIQLVYVHADEFHNVAIISATTCRKF